MRKNWTKEELIAFETEIADLYLDNQLPFLFHLSGGNEDQLIEIFRDIKEGDYVLSGHRSHYHALLHGVSPEKVKDDIMNGRSMFIYDRSKNFFVSAIIGATPGIAAGIAWALKKKGSKQKVWCFVGDGTEDSGHLFEAARYVDGWDLPCTFIIENNNRSVETSNEERWGQQADLKWNFECVRKYYYEIPFPHARLPGKIDLSKLKKKTDEKYFPKLNKEDRICDRRYSETSYKEAMPQAMGELGERECVFIGYNVRYSNGTLDRVPKHLKVEMPVAEHLMISMATGISLEGIRPVVWIERCDFLLVGIDALVNNIDKIERISHGEYQCPVIVRICIADSGPFYSGPTHSQDLSEGLKLMIPDTSVFEPKSGKELLETFNKAYNSNRPTVVFERKSLF